MAQHWSSSQESGVQFDCHANDKQLIQIQCGHSTSLPVGSQRQLTSCQENILHSFLADPEDFSCTSSSFVQTPVLDATCPWSAKERNVLEYDNILSHYSTSFGFRGQCPFPFGGNESPQADNFVWPLSIPSNRAVELPTSWPIIDPSPQSPAGPPAAGHLSGQDLTDINPQGLFQSPFGGNEHSEPDNVLLPLLIPCREAAGSPTSWTIIDSSTQSHVGSSSTGHLLRQHLTDTNSQDLFQFPVDGSECSQPGNILWSLLIVSHGEAGSPMSSTTTVASSAQSLVGPSAAEPHVTTEYDLRTVGSPQIQQAAARRRKKGGIHQCPLANCSATFTELHNLQYHKNSHWGLKPYKCSTCEFAAASPATLRRHMKLHKGTGHTIEGTREHESS